MVLLLSGARHQVGARHSARQSGSGDSACRGLLDPLRLPYEFVVRRGAPGTCGAARVVPGAARRRGAEGSWAGCCWWTGPGACGSAGGCWPPGCGPWNQFVSRVSYSGVRPSPGPPPEAAPRAAAAGAGPDGTARHRRAWRADAELRSPRRPGRADAAPADPGPGTGRAAAVRSRGGRTARCSPGPGRTGPASRTAAGRERRSPGGRTRRWSRVPAGRPWASAA